MVVEKIEAFIEDWYFNKSASFFGHGWAVSEIGETPSWNATSTILLILVLGYLLYPVFAGDEPDIHPFLLARQAQPSPIRQNGQSPVYRAVEIPYGYPLRGGLGVKDHGSPKWTSGRDGDLRDIWRRAVRGHFKDENSTTGEQGKIITVLGREKVIEHNLNEMTRDINAIGSHLQKLGAKKVGICLSNSVELLQSLFATAFYGSSATLIPFGLEQAQLTELIAKASPDVLITEAGTLDIESVARGSSSLKEVLLVTKTGSEHMDWSEPGGKNGKTKVAVWKDLVVDSSASTEVPASEKDSEVAPLSTFWPTPNGKFEIVEYTSKNIAAAIAALNFALPRGHRLTPQDLVLPLSQLWLSYPLCMTLAALYNNASIALNSVAGDRVDVELASEGIKPTIIVCSTLTALGIHTKTAQLQLGALMPVTRLLSRRQLHSGNMSDTKPAVMKKSPLSQVRLLMLSHRAGDPASPTLSTAIVMDLRIYPAVRIAYALTAGKVAGAVTQTNVLDYRDKGEEYHFGAPLSSVEIFLQGDEELMEGRGAKGKLVVRGPSVAGGEATIDVVASFNEDNTLTLA